MFMGSIFIFWEKSLAGAADKSVEHHEHRGQHTDDHCHGDQSSS
jgi:hypothetical protein